MNRITIRRPNRLAKGSLKQQWQGEDWAEGIKLCISTVFFLSISNVQFHSSPHNSEIFCEEVIVSRYTWSQMLIDHWMFERKLEAKNSNPDWNWVWIGKGNGLQSIASAWGQIEIGHGMFHRSSTPAVPLCRAQWTLMVAFIVSKYCQLQITTKSNAVSWQIFIGLNWTMLSLIENAE